MRLMQKLPPPRWTTQLGFWDICLLVWRTELGYSCTGVVVNLKISTVEHLLVLQDLDKRLVEIQYSIPLDGQCPKAEVE